MSGRHGFSRRSIASLMAATERAVEADTLARGRGLLQPIDPRVKLAGLLALILAAVLSQKLWPIAAIWLLAIALAGFCGRAVLRAMAPVWLAVLGFTGAIAVPAILLTPGAAVYRIPGLDWDLTLPGLASAAFLILRVETSATLALLLVLTTPWARVLKALRVLRVPVVFVVTLGMAFRYILLLLETASQMFESRQSRTVGKLSGREHRRLAVASGGVLLTKTVAMSGEVYLAMQSRGFRGEVWLLDEFQMGRRDWAALTLFAAASAAAILAGR